MRYDYYESVELLKNLSDEEALFKLTKPTLFKVKGTNSKEAVLVSVMLHGNEPCGFRAFLKEINSNPTYPVDVYFFVGNVIAAQQKPYFTTRLLKDGLNFNRIWGKDTTHEDHKLAKEVLIFLETLPIKAHLDLHSFTAKDLSPHSFTGSKEKAHLDFMKHLIPYIFVVDIGDGGMVTKTMKFGPALVVECGTNNSKEADVFAYTTLQKFFYETNVKEGKNEDQCKGIYSGMSNIKVKYTSSVSFAREEQDTDVTFLPTNSQYNINEIKAGTHLGWAKSLDHLRVLDQSGIVDASELFNLEGHKIILKKDVTQNLFSPVEPIIKESGFYFFTNKELL